MFICSEKENYSFIWGTVSQLLLKQQDQDISPSSTTTYNIPSSLR